MNLSPLSNRSLNVLGRQVIAAVLLLTPLTSARAADGPHAADIIIYGGTTGGVLSAIAATREGASVFVLEPGEHVGGMVTSGLGFTDTGLEPPIPNRKTDLNNRGPISTD